MVVLNNQQFLYFLDLQEPPHTVTYHMPQSQQQEGDYRQPNISALVNIIDRGLVAGMHLVDHDVNGSQDEGDAEVTEGKLV